MTAADGPDQLAALARANALGNVLRRSAARHGAKTALVDGERRFSYTEFDAAADAAAASLERSGIDAGDRVALLSRNCWEFSTR